MIILTKTDNVDEERRSANRGNVSRPFRTGNQRSENVHAAVLRAASELIAEKGYLNVTIEAIAARAACGKQTIYRWWPAKADLYMELYTVLADEIIKPADTGSIIEDLRILYRQLLTLFTTTVAGSLLAGLVAEAQSNPRLTNKLYSGLVIGRRVNWIRLLERAQKRGEIPKSFDLEFAVDVLSGPVWYRLLLGNAPLDEDFAEKLVQNLLHGFLPQKGGSRPSSGKSRAASPKKKKSWNN